jgi:RimJ/RimL family protein N-acetyltransferase
MNKIFHNKLAYPALVLRFAQTILLAVALLFFQFRILPAAAAKPPAPDLKTTIFQLCAKIHALTKSLRPKPSPLSSDLKPGMNPPTKIEGNRIVLVAAKIAQSQKETNQQLCETFQSGVAIGLFEKNCCQKAETAGSFLVQIASEPGISYLVFLKSENKIIGGIKIKSVDDAVGQFAWWMHSAFQKKGYATEALDLITRTYFAIASQEIEKFNAHVNVTNTNSEMVLRSYGFSNTKYYEPKTQYEQSRQTATPYWQYNEGSKTFMVLELIKKDWYENYHKWLQTKKQTGKYCWHAKDLNITYDDNWPKK